jgi:K+-sensing histidine kinase KdpD
LANMSHELRTPLNAIRGMTSLALQGDLPPSLRVRLNIIDAASKSLLHIVSEILDFSKTEAGQLQIQREDFQLQDTLASVLSMVESKARDKGLVLHFPKVLDVPGALIGDPQRLGQVLFNLLTNAIKFTPKGEITLGVERVSASKTAVVLRFQIRDTGIGMSKEQMSILFSPFTQADTSRTRNYGGTGLGLSLCKRLINMMGGEVGVESEPSLGSVFHFTAQFGRHASGRNAVSKVHNEKQAVLPVACKMVSDPVVLRASLDALAAFLQTRRPKPCRTALETVAALDWPGPLQENTVELDRLITKYKFKEALAVVEDMQGKLQTILSG